jgi:hypothetical protein
MKKSVSFGIAFIAIVLLAALLVLPVSGAIASTTSMITTSPAAAGVTPAKPYISATVGSAAPTVGDPVTIRGVATGGNLTDGVQMWVFAGNYLNVAHLPVNADGTFSNTYQTAALPPAMYYVFVQSPAMDGQFDIDLIDAGIRTGQVVNTRTNAIIFNFTGTGSVHDTAASIALSNALNQPGQDDIFTKLTIQLTAPVATPAAALTTGAVPSATAAPTAAPTAKSSLPLEVTAGALVISGCCAALSMRKIH